MDRSARSKLNAQIYDEACEWFIEFRAGEVDSAQRRALDQWLRKSPEHLRAYLEIAAIWNEGPTLDPANKWDMSLLIAQAADERDNVTRLEHGRAIGSPVTMRPRLHGNTRRFVAVAASVLLVALGAWIYGQRNLYATDIGEQRSIRLTDGSTVDLNSRSRLEVRFSDGERRVDLLEGQALFQVAKDTARPFIVRSDTTRVRAVGTQFDVNRRKSGTIVTVLEGQVAVVSDARDRATAAGSAIPTEDLIFLSAGEQVSVKDHATLRSTAANLSSATAWKKCQLVFESAALAEVVEEFNRYNERQLVIEDAELHAFRISGVFSSSEPDSLLQFLRTRQGVQVTDTGDRIRIAKKLSR